MQQSGTAGPFKALLQSPLATVALKRFSYVDAMDLVAAVPAYRAAIGLPD